jgi:hypothetical protein
MPAKVPSKGFNTADAEGMVVKEMLEHYNT